MINEHMDTKAGWLYVRVCVVYQFVCMHVCGAYSKSEEASVLQDASKRLNRKHKPKLRESATKLND